MKWNPSELVARLGKEAMAARFQLLTSWIKARPRVSLAIAGGTSLVLIVTGLLLTLPRSGTSDSGTADAFSPPAVSEDSPPIQQPQELPNSGPTVADAGPQTEPDAPNQHPSESVDMAELHQPVVPPSQEPAAIEPAEYANLDSAVPDAAPAAAEVADTAPRLPEPPPGAGRFIFEPANDTAEPVQEEDVITAGALPGTMGAAEDAAPNQQPLPHEFAGPLPHADAAPETAATGAQAIGSSETEPQLQEAGTPPGLPISSEDGIAMPHDATPAPVAGAGTSTETASESPLHAGNDLDPEANDPQAEAIPANSVGVEGTSAAPQSGSGNADGSAVMPAEFAQAELAPPAAPPGDARFSATPEPHDPVPQDPPTPDAGVPAPAASALPEPGGQEPIPGEPRRSPAAAPDRPTGPPSAAPALGGTQQEQQTAPRSAEGRDAPELPSAASQDRAHDGFSLLEDAPPAASPALSVQVHGPQEIQLGTPCTYRLVVRNNGTTTAEGVQLVARATGPFAELQADPAADVQKPYLIWNLGSLKPGSSKVVTLRLKPVDEGEISVAARVLVAANVASRTRVTQARLTLVKVGPTQVEVGERVKFLITVSNPGTGTARNVVIRDAIPDAFTHPAGSELEYTVGDLGPGESREVPLEVTAVKAGSYTNTAVATADGGLKAEASATVVVTEAKLSVTKTGPERRYLGDQVTYTITVSNTGTAPARGVTVVDTLPQQLQLKTAPPTARVSSDGRSLTWSIDILPPGARKTYQVTCSAARPGEARNRVVATARGGLKAESECVTMIIAVPALLLEVVDTDDPLEVGATTTYEVRIVNQGTKPISGLILTMELPEGMEFVAADAPAGFKETTNGIVFDSIPSIAPRASAAFYIRVRGLTPGDKRIRVRVQTGPLGVPVIEEESTKVYDGG